MFRCAPWALAWAAARADEPATATFEAQSLSVARTADGRFELSGLRLDEVPDEVHASQETSDIRKATEESREVGPRPRRPPRVVLARDQLATDAAAFLTRVQGGAKPLLAGARVNVAQSKDGPATLTLEPASARNRSGLAEVVPGAQAAAIALENYVGKYTAYEAMPGDPGRRRDLRAAQVETAHALGRVVFVARVMPEVLITVAENSAQLQQEFDATQAIAGPGAPGLYGPDDVFRVEAYSALLSNVQRVAGFFAPTRPDVVLGAGVFVGPRVVLTCEHCLPVLAPGASLVRRVVGATPVQYRYVGPLARGSAFAASDPAYGDVALIEVAPVDSAVPALPPLGVASAASVGVWNPVYVLAFNKNDNQVPGIYDDAHVLFPVQATTDALGMILFRAIVQRYQAASVLQAQAQLTGQGFETDVNNILEAYAYVPAPTNPAALYYFRRPVNATGFQCGPHLRFGFDTSTVAGESGGGVFSKATGALIGIFGVGSSDDAAPAPADFERHEEAAAWSVARALLASYRDHPAAPPALDLDVSLAP